jgi:POLQ-like helicase
LREYIKSGDTLFEIGSGTERCRESLLKISRSLHPPSAAKRKIDPDGLALLVSEVAPNHCCLVFCSTKKSCENVAQLISRNLPSNLLEWKPVEKRKLKIALKVKKKETYFLLLLFIGVTSWSCFFFLFFVRLCVYAIHF